MTRGLLLAGLFAVALAISLYTQWPLAAALAYLSDGEPQFRAARVTGTIWSGEIEALSYRGMDFGDVAPKTDPAGLLVGTADAEILARGGAIAGSGRLLRGAGKTAIENARFAVDLTRLPLLVPARGTARVVIDRVAFENGRCIDARGRVELDDFVLENGGASWAVPPLDGAARCVGDRAEIAISNAESRDDRAYRIRLRLRANGDYEMRILIDGVDAATGARLSLIGFAAKNGGYELLQRNVRQNS